MAKDYFITSGYPKRDGNFVLPLICGEDAWQQVCVALKNAKKSIHMTFWGLELDLELKRDSKNTFNDPDKREDDKLATILLDRCNNGVKVRILLWDWFARTAANPGIDRLLYTWGKNNVFEVIYQSHPNSIGSWHQKAIIIDDDVAFVGGMNAKQNDWDTKAHTLYDYRRTPHTTSGSKRTQMQKKKVIPDYAPRQDYMAQLKGNVVADVQNNFIERWNYCIDTSADFSGKSTKLSKINPTAFSTLKAQVSRTVPAYPPTPVGEQNILETYRKAIRLAEKYIYIEDQYFRSQVVAQEIANACKKNNKLKVIAVTQPDYLSEIESHELWKAATPSTFWTTKAFNLIKKEVPDFCLFYLNVTDSDNAGNRLFKPINLHAKIMIIDDEWYTIGSCNFNDRGFQTEGELNVSVQDESAIDFRKKVISMNLETACPDDINDAIKLWYDHAKKNHDAWKNKTAPISRVYPFNQKGPLIPTVPKDWF